MITLNGLSTDYFIASGARNFNGYGHWFEFPYRMLGLLRPNDYAIISKTVTLKPKAGNLNWKKRFGGCVRFLDHDGNALNEWQFLTQPSRMAGTVNAVGLTNKGIDWWCWQFNNHWRFDQERILIPSILAADVNEAVVMAQKIVELRRPSSFFGDRLHGLSLNLSCGNCTEGTQLISNTKLSVEIALAVKETIGDLALLVKLSPQQDYLVIADALAGKATAFDINSAPWDLIFPDKPSPLQPILGIAGGVSGKVAQPILWPMARQLVKLNAAPVIGPSVWNYEDIETLRNHIGCQAVHFGALHLRGVAGPALPDRYKRRYTAQNSPH